MLSPNPVKTGAVTLADKAEAQVQADILSGRLVPGQRLALPALLRDTGIGLTPLREALSRLTARGLVEAEGNRGFRVASASPADLADITATRVVIETGALRLCMAQHSGDWEDGLVAATHRLTRTIRQFAGPISENIQAYDAAHRHFHHALLAGCGVPRLLALHADLYDQAYRYRRLLADSGMDPDRAIHEHSHLAELALGTDAEAACAALADHLHLTARVFPKD